MVYVFGLNGVLIGVLGLGDYKFIDLECSCLERE